MTITSDVDVRPITRPDDLADVDSLYRQVFLIRDGDSGVNVRLLSALGANSGHVVGAYAGVELVGFGLSFLAREACGRLYQYSQTVAVAPRWQTRGLGRRLKQAQREAALRDGVDLLRWVFDPMHARNGHFNLDVLGGRVRRLHRDLYGAAAPGRDVGEPTDRCVVDWELRAPVPTLPPSIELDLAPGEHDRVGDVVAVAVPSDWRETRIELGPAAAGELRSTVVDRLDAALSDGREIVACRRIGTATAAYLLITPDRSAS